jgi:hypothetical protein
MFTEVKSNKQKFHRDDLLSMNKPQSERLFRTCAWCTQEISEDEDIFGFGAKANRSVNLSDKEGEFVSLRLALQEKTIFALVSSSSSAARVEGYDLVFITCSEDCAHLLKDALELERDVFDNDS